MVPGYRGRVRGMTIEKSRGRGRVRASKFIPLQTSGFYGSNACRIWYCGDSEIISHLFGDLEVLKITGKLKHVI